MSAPVPPRTVLAVLLLLCLSCATSAERMRPEEERRQAEPGVVRASELPGGALKLSFEPVAPNLALERLRVEEARTLLSEDLKQALEQEGITGTRFVEV